MVWRLKYFFGKKFFFFWKRGMCLGSWKEFSFNFNIPFFFTNTGVPFFCFITFMIYFSFQKETKLLFFPSSLLLFHENSFSFWNNFFLKNNPKLFILQLQLFFFSIFTFQLRFYYTLRLHWMSIFKYVMKKELY